jgi:hypothetical protein
MPDSLLDRVRQGDREALQQYITDLEAGLRRRVRGKFSRIDSAYDEDDMLASARRRLDGAFVRGLFKPASEAETNAYIRRACDRVVMDVCRAARRRRWRERQAARYESVISTNLSEIADTVFSIARSLDHREREAMRLWLQGLSHASITRSLGMTLFGYRSWWRRLRQRMAQSA